LVAPIPLARPNNVIAPHALVRQDTTHSMTFLTWKSFISIFVLKLYIIFTSILTISNVKTQNYKVVDLIESYNFDINDIFI
jgi:hypothetical protein